MVELAGSSLNKGRSWRLRVSRCGGVDFSLAGRGGEGREWCRHFIVRSGVAAARLVSQKFWCLFCCTVEKMRQIVKLQRVEEARLLHLCMNI